MKKIGLALGGGGAKGFAHIPILEVFDELGVKPSCITGTSIGSIMRALYASGLSADKIAEVSTWIRSCKNCRTIAANSHILQGNVRSVSLRALLSFLN